MPIVVSCQCGKRMRAPDGSGGRRAKCAGCGTILTIPMPEVAVAIDGKLGLATAGVAVAPRNIDAAPAPLRDAPESRKTAPERSPFDEDDFGAYDVVAAPVAPRPAARPPTVAPVGLAAKPARPVDADAPFRPVAPDQQAKPRTWDRYLYLVLMLALIPLACSTLGRGEDERDEGLGIIERTIVAHPEVEPQIIRVITAMAEGEATDADLFAALPGHRFVGAMLPRDTWAHWGMALLAGAAFFGLTLAVFPPGGTRPLHLLYVGLFTATIGIAMLLAFQAMADLSLNVRIRGGGLVAIILLVAKLIGFSYHAASDPSNGFLLSFLGYTAGVGYCEELCKAMPLLWHYRGKATMGWRAACRWGFITGVGFGVCEGIMYSARHYNGVGGAEIYLVRFVSCVALHAVWSTIGGLMICRHQQRLQDADPWWMVPIVAGVLLAGPVLLHGLYNTCLEKGHPAAALVMAFVSFAWLAWLVESMRRKEERAAAYGFSLAPAV